MVFVDPAASVGVGSLSLALASGVGVVASGRSAGTRAGRSARMAADLASDLLAASSAELAAAHEATVGGLMVLVTGLAVAGLALEPPLAAATASVLLQSGVVLASCRLRTVGGPASTKTAPFKRRSLK